MANVIRIIFFFPIHLLLWIILRLRHLLYDTNIFSSEQFSVPVFCVGNLELGGSGKTPMVDLLLQIFNSKKNIAFLSRGYGRSSRGFRWLENCAGPDEAGDEPWQLFAKWRNKVVFAVDEDRVRGIKRILAERPEINLVMLDDAFQHRAVRPAFNILLTPFHRPFFRNFLFPAGSLRDIRQAASRADMLVFTKAPSGGEAMLEQATAGMQSAVSGPKQVFVSEVQYLNPVNNQGIVLPEFSEVTCIAGIAQNEAFFRHCRSQFKVTLEVSLPDHFRYSPEFFEKRALTADAGILLCTEKDFAKIITVFPFPEKVFYLPIQIRIFPQDLFISSLEKHLPA